MTSRDTTTEPADTSEDVDATTPDAATSRATVSEAAQSDLTPAEESTDDPTPESTEGETDAEAEQASAKAKAKASGKAEKVSAKAEKADKASRRAPRKASRRADAAPATTGRRRRRWPLVAAVVVSALFAGGMVTLFLVSRPAPIAGLTRTQDAAVSAARQAAINLQTYRRASFDQDFANALASTTPDFRSQQLEPRKDALKQQLVTGGRDTTASVLSAGLVTSTASQAEVLVITNTTQTADDGSSTPFLVSRLQITVQLVGGTWLLSDLSNVGLS